jgi:hypothetical protein
LPLAKVRLYASLLEAFFLNVDWISLSGIEGLFLRMQVTSLEVTHPSRVCQPQIVGVDQ